MDGPEVRRESRGFKPGSSLSPTEDLNRRPDVRARL